MDLSQAIENRRSIRQYTGEPVSQDDLERIIQAGIWAPSGLNNQPWKFKVVTGETKDGLTEFTKYKNIVAGASTAICVFLDKTVMYDRDKDLMGIGACIQNMLLQAHALDVGTCWLGEILSQKDKVKDYLVVAGDYELMAVITCGHYNGTDARGSRKKYETFMLD
ncbi:MAG: nitroreductase [Anaerolineales bacterium]|nr:nitroreductase [Anaerolineales bacterium]